MVKQLFKAGFKFDDLCSKDKSLFLSEMFYDTIQGEGRYAGYPAVFMRLGGCTLNCSFCDSKEVWNQAKDVPFELIFQKMEDEGVIKRLLVDNHHLILTGGSPLRQQKRLESFLTEFMDRYGDLPFIEVENESVLIPSEFMNQIVDHWNNSPKLENSNNKSPYKKDVIEVLQEVRGTYDWKFVIASKEDWDEIVDKYINNQLIDPCDVILMPCGATREELSETRDLTINLAIENNVRFMDRLHVVAWDKKTGV